MSLLIGLTGNIGSGKTLVATQFEKLGGHVIDADKISRQLVEPGLPALNEIVEQFGESVLTPDRALDREKLAAIVFDDAARKKTLEKILHPRVFQAEQEMYSSLREKDPRALVVIDAALLIESGNYKNVDKVVLVACDEETQIRRVLERGSLSREEIKKRLRSQMSLQEKRKYADYVIDNNSSLDNLNRAVESLFNELKTLAARS